ncbi:hypothetical protein HDV01_002973 [Terramyces sp. JEL0728]|nr:hypothetical protein HDV01_002973 [Terramyces sp. JEL0728]
MLLFHICCFKLVLSAQNTNNIFDKRRSAISSHSRINIFGDADRAQTKIDGNGNIEISSGSTTINVNNNGDNTISSTTISTNGGNGRNGVSGTGANGGNAGNGGIGVSGTAANGGNGIITSNDDSKDRIDLPGIPVPVTQPTSTGSLPQVTTTYYQNTESPIPTVASQIVLVSKVPVSTISPVSSTDSISLKSNPTMPPNNPDQSSANQTTSPQYISQFIIPIVAIVVGILLVSSFVLFCCFYSLAKKSNKDIDSEQLFDVITLSDGIKEKATNAHLSEQDLNSDPPTFPASASTVDSERTSYRIPSMSFTSTDKEIPIDTLEILCNDDRNDPNTNLGQAHIKNEPTVPQVQPSLPNQTQLPKAGGLPKSLLAILTDRLSKLSFGNSKLSAAHTTGDIDNPFKAKHNSVESAESLSVYL